MSTAPVVPPVTLDVSGTPRTPFLRLVQVEWRKMIDTRSGFWLLAITAGLLALVMALIVLVVGLNDFQVDARGISQGMTIPVSLLLPVFAILIVTSEWSQRTALTSFTLEPHRSRVVLAKLVAVATLAVGTIAVAFVLGALTNVLCAAVTGNPLEWNLDGSELFWAVVQQMLYFAMGFALGMLLLNTPGAIAIYYVIALLLPLMVWGTLYAIFDWAKDLLPWVDLGFAIAPLSTGADPLGRPVDVEALTYVQTGFTALVWVGVPVALGMWRILRAEVK
jgi:ABC-type transport system involved in multi-copper enzyme maturation permease subunit